MSVTWARRRAIESWNLSKFCAMVNAAARIFSAAAAACPAVAAAADAAFAA